MTIELTPIDGGPTNEPRRPARAAKILATARVDRPHRGYVEPSCVRYRRAALASLENGDVAVAQVYATLASAVAVDDLDVDPSRWVG